MSVRVTSALSPLQHENELSVVPSVSVSWELNSLTSWVALKGLQGKVKKLVILLNMLSNLLVDMLFRNRLLISQNVAIMSTFFWEVSH